VNQSDPQEVYLRLVQNAAETAEQATVALHNRIRDARAGGLSLRAIAAAANLSPEWVRKIAS
jgi:DNA-binding Lrp family transcriptional regulator